MYLKSSGGPNRRRSGPHHSSYFGMKISVIVRFRPGSRSGAETHSRPQSTISQSDFHPVSLALRSVPLCLNAGRCYTAYYHAAQCSSEGLRINRTPCRPIRRQLPGGSPFIIGEFVAHDSSPQFWEFESQGFGPTATLLALGCASALTGTPPSAALVSRASSGT